jgi:2-oxoglutarate ferredoxin oxidoreductase subunit beta
MLATIPSAAYITRVSVYDIPHIVRAKAAIKKAFQMQIEGKGFSLVEVLSTCPTNWGLTPIESISWLKENMEPYYPLGVYKDVSASEGGN